MALECVEGADVARMSDERGRRACGAAGFVRAGRRPDPTRLLRRDRSGGVTPGCRGHETGISARDRHFRASPTGPSSDSRRNVEFDVPRRCASGAVPPRTQDRARSWPPAPSSDSNRNAHVGGAISGRSWRRRRTRSECPRRRDHQCGRDDQEARRASHGSHSTLAVRVGRPRPRQAHRPGRGPHPYAQPLPDLGTRSHSS